VVAEVEVVHKLHPLVQVDLVVAVLELIIAQVVLELQTQAVEVEVCIMLQVLEDLAVQV
jgi:hypothetical protein